MPPDTEQLRATYNKHCLVVSGHTQVREKALTHLNSFTQILFFKLPREKRNQMLCMEETTATTASGTAGEKTAAFPHIWHIRLRSLPTQTVLSLYLGRTLHLWVCTQTYPSLCLQGSGHAISVPQSCHVITMKQEHLNYV